MKICKVCIKEKDYSLFYKDGARNDGYSKECKECCNIRKTKYRNENREHVNLVNRENAKKHIEKKSIREKKRYEENRYEICAKNRENYSLNKEKIRKRQNELQKTPEKRLKASERQKKYCKDNNEARKNFIKKWMRDNRLKLRAHYAISDAIRRGKIIRPNRCEICGMECKPDGHHTDYTKPLAVMWLCKICHMHKHNKLLDIIPNGIQV